VNYGGCLCWPPNQRQEITQLLHWHTIHTPPPPPATHCAWMLCYFDRGQHSLGSCDLGAAAAVLFNIIPLNICHTLVWCSRRIFIYPVVLCATRIYGTSELGMSQRTGSRSGEKVALPMQIVRLYVYTANKVRPVVTINTTCLNILKFCILPTQCIFMFHMILTRNSDIYPKQY
jgi:hypothetical protein